MALAGGDVGGAGLGAATEWGRIWEFYGEYVGCEPQDGNWVELEELYGTAPKMVEGLMSDWTCSSYDKRTMPRALKAKITRLMKDAIEEGEES